MQVCPNCGLRAPTVPADQPILPEGVVGKPHRAWLVLLSTWLLQPVFWPLYLWFTFQPLDKQHNREHPILAWIITVVPLLGVFLGIPYAWMGLKRLQRSRRARGLKRGLGPWTFLLVSVPLQLGTLGLAALLVASEGDLSAGFDFSLLFDGAAYETFLNLEAWHYAALVGGLLGPAVALAWAAASANKLWHAIYEEKGEAWPWREA
jgi:hypothetical protein